MSSETLPITPYTFADAIKELELPVLYAKVAELRNSIIHLQRSNREMQAFITENAENDADKQELEGYIAENEVVRTSMNERIQLCKAEVERRGQTWIELAPETGVDENAASGAETETGEQGREQEGGPAAASNGTGSNANGPPERSGGQDNDGGDDGVYL
ncbi:hypothetical protein BDV18DRAFT_132718 [Aspergillus unguis]